MAEIISIHVVQKKNAAAESCNHVTVRSNFGITDDYRSEKFQIRQITLIEAETIDAMSRKLGYDIPAGSSRRQIMVKGIKLNELIGRNLRMGQILVRVEDKCNPCKNMETKIGLGAEELALGWKIITSPTFGINLPHTIIMSPFLNPFFNENSEKSSFSKSISSYHSPQTSQYSSKLMCSFVS